MSRHDEVKAAYKSLGKEASFYDGMMTYSKPLCSLNDRLRAMYKSVLLEAVESEACFTCQKAD